MWWVLARIACPYFHSLTPCYLGPPPPSPCRLILIALQEIRKILHKDLLLLSIHSLSLFAFFLIQLVSHPTNHPDPSKLLVVGFLQNMRCIFILFNLHTIFCF